MRFLPHFMAEKLKFYINFLKFGDIMVFSAIKLAKSGNLDIFSKKIQKNDIFLILSSQAQLLPFQQDRNRSWASHLPEN